MKLNNISLDTRTRNSIGRNSKVVYDGQLILIKNLPLGQYNLVHNGDIFAEGVMSEAVLEKIIDYCDAFGRKGVVLNGRSASEKVSKLNIIAEVVR